MNQARPEHVIGKRSLRSKFQMPHFRPAEGAFLVYQFFLLVVSLPHAYDTTFPFSVMLSVLFSICLTIFCRSFRPDHPFLRVLCEFFYLYVVVFISYFTTCHLIGYYRTDRFDLALSSLDQRFFGVTPDWWSSLLNHPWITEFFTWGYISYYFFGILLIVPIYIRYGAKSRAFQESFNSIILAFLITYIGYWTIPAAGPRVYWEAQLPPLQLLFLSSHVFGPMDHMAKGFPDAFPSEHTSLSLLVLWFLYKHDRQIFWFALPFAVTAVGATIVLRYHWVTDVMAGLVVTVVVAGLSTWLAGRKHGYGDDAR